MTEINAAKRTWTLTLHPGHLALADPSGAEPHIVSHQEMLTTATLLEGMRTLALTKPVKLNFKLPPETQSALIQWIGRPALARTYLKRRNAWVWPFAIIWVFSSMPVPGDPATGRAPLPLDLFGLCLGMTLIVTWAWARWRPHPVLFLIDSLWFLSMAVHLGIEVAGGRSIYWLLWVALLLWMVVTGFKQFVRFKGVRLAAN